LTRVDDALAAAALGVDAIGVVLTRRSRRVVDIDRARDIFRALPPFVTTVALFMDDEPAFVAAAVTSISPHLVQFHGSETAADCVRYGRPYLKSVAMGLGPEGRGEDWLSLVAAHPQAAGFLFDGHAVGEAGGTGRTFDWSSLPATIGKPIILAGGLDGGNVGAAVRQARPFAVDVSSGIEAEPGVKDADKMRRFIAAVNEADEEDQWQPI
jgi:phosphoribosylanthranilate isomerase